MPLERSVERSPREAPSLAAPVKPFVQHPARLAIEQAQASKIAHQPVVVPRPLELGPQRLQQPP